MYFSASITPTYSSTLYYYPQQPLTNYNQCYSTTNTQYPLSTTYENQQRNFLINLNNSAKSKSLDSVNIYFKS